MADLSSTAGEQASNDNTTLASDGSVVSAAVVTVNIKTLNGPDFELAVKRNVLVSELKTKVRERTDVDEVRFELFMCFTYFFYRFWERFLTLVVTCWIG